VAACSMPSSDMTPAQRDDAFWVAYEQRTGMVGRDYADDMLAQGTDPRFLTSHSSIYTEQQLQVQLETATEFLCPDQVDRVKA
jgi:hypothetical protein